MKIEKLSSYFPDLFGEQKTGKMAGEKTQPEYQVIEVADLPPPKPLKNTLENLAELDDDVVLVQINDRKPQHLYPRLEERGYEYKTVASKDNGDAIITAIWKSVEK